MGLWQLIAGLIGYTLAGAGADYLKGGREAGVQKEMFGLQAGETAREMALNRQAQASMMERLTEKEQQARTRMEEHRLKMRGESQSDMLQAAMLQQMFTQGGGLEGVRQLNAGAQGGLSSLLAPQE